MTKRHINFIITGTLEEDDSYPEDFDTFVDCRLSFVQLDLQNYVTQYSKKLLNSNISIEVTIDTITLEPCQLTNMRNLI